MVAWIAMGLALAACRPASVRMANQREGGDEAALGRRHLRSEWTGIEKVPSERLPNLVRVHPHVYSGGMPVGDQAFAELRCRGFQTVISVDGAKPDVEAARRHGLRYVHLPHGYDGVSESRAEQLAKAVRDLPGPIFVHCHHGKHRSPTAAAVACVTSGLINVNDARQVLRVAGTSEHYQGLHRSVDGARRVDDRRLEELPPDFPEIAKLPAMAEAMVEIEHAHDHLSWLAAAHWGTVEDQPALVPAHEALLLRELLTELLRCEEIRDRPPRFFERLEESEMAARELEELLRAGERSGDNNQRADAAWHTVSESCTQCHREFRDVPLNSRP